MDGFGTHEVDIHRYGGELQKRKDLQSLKLREIKELSFVCTTCGKLRRLTNSQLYKNKSKQQQDDEEDMSEIEANALEKQNHLKECNKCFISKL